MACQLEKDCESIVFNFICLHVHVVQNGTTHIVYFLVPGHPGSVTGTCLAREEHGLTRVQLLKPDLPDITMPDDVWTFDVTAPKVRKKGGDYTSVSLLHALSSVMHY